MVALTTDVIGIGDGDGDGESRGDGDGEMLLMLPDPFLSSSFLGEAVS